MRARILASENRKWWTLGAVAFALFMIMLDNTVVNVALPSIQRSLDAGISQLEWVVNGYALTFAVLMLTGGKLADLFGRRQIFLLGLVVFTGASLACGLAGSAGELIAWRALQGAGAALMMPATLAIISAAFPPRQRGLAIGIWAGVSAMALAIGPLLGGILTEHIDWSWIFFVNVPVGLLGLIVGLIVIEESRDTSLEQSLDLPGLMTSAGALFALTFALIEANSYGWTSPLILGLFGAAIAGLALFVLIEHRRRAPMLDLSLFRNRTFTGANIVALMVTFAMFGVFFFMSLFVQQILGYSPVQAGAIFLPMTVLIIFIAPVAGKLSDRIGSRWLMAGGLTLVGISLVIFSRLDVSSDFWDLLPGLVIGGVGMASVMTPMSAAAMGSVQLAKAGVASGVLNTFRQVGGALGIAVLGAILTSRQTSALAAGASPAEAFVDGFQTALLVAAVIAFVGAVTAAVLVRQVTHPEVGRDRGACGVTATKRVRLAAARAPRSSSRLRAARVLGRQLPGHDDGVDRPRGGRDRADPLPPLHVEAGAVPRLPRRIMGARARALGARRREEPEPAHWVRAMALAYRDAAGLRNVISSLWIQALAEASEDQEIGAYMSRHLGDIHAFVADVYRRAQAAGGVAEGRVPEVEAWIFLAIGLLRAADDRLGGPVDEYFPGIGASRQAWLTGASADRPRSPADHAFRCPRGRSAPEKRRRPGEAALRPSRASGSFVATDSAPLPGVPDEVRTNSTIARTPQKSSSLVK